MPNNVWGYNLSTSRNQFAIHLRLRMPTSHELLPYDSVARTMAHEMAHCVHGSHSADFYELMEDIVRQHEDFVERGIVLDKFGFPIGSDKVYTLGGAGTNRNNHYNNNSWKQKSLQELRKTRRDLFSGHTLSVSRTSQNKSSNSSEKKVLPKEAARLAAEKRRLEDSSWCLPCEEVIEILDDNDNDIDDRIFLPKLPIQPTEIIQIDLTSDDEPLIQPNCSNIRHKNSSHTDKGKLLKGSKSLLPKIWTCKTCTFENEIALKSRDNPKATILVCVMCSMPQVSEQENLKVIESILHEEESKHICREEETRSKEQFQGFNIYGNTNTSTSTLKHLT